MYDTNKDSDGGVEHRTQDTSWYNEPVSATRDAKKFPAVAVIVTTQKKVTIYDGTIQISMWMHLNLINTQTFNLGYTPIGLGYCSHLQQNTSY